MGSRNRLLRTWLPIVLLIGTGSFVARAVFGPQFGHSVPMSGLSQADRTLLVIGCVSFVCFWLLMLVHLMRGNANTKHPVAWGLSLIFLSWLAALGYYFLVYRREAGTPSPSSLRDSA
jgi:hypothetical protein